MRFLLWSLSIIYGIIIKLRNALFDYGIWEIKEHNIPIICIGNLSLGGTGKTPHTNYIAKILSEKYKVAILSRGYGRRSSGFNYVDLNSTTSTVGDEPLQLKLNNPNCIVAVNNNRNNGVQKILMDHPETNLILLDDGLQHRKIKAGLNIITTPFYKPFIKDHLLPLGRLREPISEAKRADIILITDTPKSAHQKEANKLIESLNLETYQKGYLSSITYQKYKCIKNNTELENENEYNITLVTGIANPTTLKNHLQKRGRKVNLIRFSDHHNYTLKDVKNILLIHNKDIGIDVVINEKQKFKKQLLDYVRAS